MHEPVAPSMPAGVDPSHEAFIDQVRKRYLLPPDASVTDFLNRHWVIPQVLVRAADRLKECFGAETVVSLRAPVDEYGSQTLYAVVLWPGQAHDARNALERFDDAWWIANSRPAAGNLTFTYELV